MIHWVPPILLVDNNILLHIINIFAKYSCVSFLGNAPYMRNEVLLLFYPIQSIPQVSVTYIYEMLTCRCPSTLGYQAISRSNHYDVIKWKHFPHHWPFVRGIHRSPVNSPHKGQWRGALMSSLICTQINGWVNNREAGDLRRNRAHYDVIVMCWVTHKFVSKLTTIGSDNGLSPGWRQAIIWTNDGILLIGP